MKCFSFIYFCKPYKQLFLEKRFPKYSFSAKQMELSPGHRKLESFYALRKNELHFVIFWLISTAYVVFQCLNNEWCWGLTPNIIMNCYGVLKKATNRFFLNGILFEALMSDFEKWQPRKLVHRSLFFGRNCCHAADRCFNSAFWL